MTDKELTDFAVAAYGDAPENFSPLTDDGDEARLESALSLWVSWHPAGVLVGPEVCSPNTGSAYMEYFDQHNGDKQAARRRAGTKAAAEIGKLIP